MAENTTAGMWHGFGGVATRLHLIGTLEAQGENRKWNGLQKPQNLPTVTHILQKGHST